MLCHSLSPAARHFTSPDHNHTYLCHTLLILFTPLTPVSGLVATRTKFMTKTASSAIHSLFPGFRLLVISLYDFLVYWLLSQQDSLSIAFHISESRASWIPRLRFPEFRASWLPRLRFPEFSPTMHTFVCCISEMANRKANYSETAHVTMETINKASFSIYIATAYQKWLTEKF